MAEQTAQGSVPTAQIGGLALSLPAIRVEHHITKETQQQALMSVLLILAMIGALQLAGIIIRKAIK